MQNMVPLVFCISSMQVYSFIEAQKQINGTSRHECAIFSVYREISGIPIVSQYLHTPGLGQPPLQYRRTTTYVVLEGLSILIMVIVRGERLAATIPECIY